MPCRIKLKKGDVPDSYFDEIQLKIGMEVEKEHTDDPEIAKEIAKAHLSERPDYYKKLLEAGL
jgi:antitoxin component of MazEF toxin-antitoxin module